MRISFSLWPMSKGERPDKVDVIRVGGDLPQKCAPIGEKYKCLNYPD